MTALMMLFSSMAGCLDRTEEEEPTAMVSTYHVGQLVSAIAGDTMNVEMMSTTNIPVHDYEPSAADIVRLQESDIFFYHGLNLEPWVESALSSLGENAPKSVQTHAMPSGETELDFESMLVSDLCELLAEGPYESTTLGHEDHEGHEGHEDHANETEENHTEEDGHEDHNHAEAEETIQNPEGCPADTVISVFHMEAGEHVLEFEGHHDETFNMAVLKMPGGHAHHHHDHGHAGPFEWAGVFEIADSSHTWTMQKVDGAYADPSMRLVLIPTDAATEEAMEAAEEGVGEMIEGDSCTVIEDGETMTPIAAEGSCFELHVGVGDDSTFTIDTTGVSALAAYAQHVPTEFERDAHYLADSAGNDIEPVAQESVGSHDHDHGGHGEEGEIEAGEDEEAFNYDPHSWLDPVSFKEQAKVVLEALKEAFPSDASTFTANAESYMSQLDSLHSDFQTALPSDSSCTDNKVIANHNAYSYLAKRYDLKFISIHGLDPEGEPSAADIAEAVEEINEEGITVLFIEEYTSESAVDSIVEQTKSDTMPNGVGVEYLYTMEMEPKDISDDYISMMRKSMNSLKEGLGC
tara:strand:+ start:98 stop:1828 length:1731 start_codon:yes stop_codon:yes gene_type:complete